MDLDDYASHDALGLAGLVRRGEVSAAELEAAARRGIEAVNGRINAVIGDVPEAARRAETVPDAIFRGVPFLLKDLGHGYAGVPCGMGSRLAEGFVVAQDSTFAARCKASGLNAIGRTNTPEFGLSGATEPVVNGPTRNPWNTDLVPGGSSGGSAAAVAAGIVPIAHGSDAGGSIRTPAAWNNLVGHKPSRGLVPKGPQASDATSPLSVNFVLTRTVRDTAAFLDAVSGPAAGDYVVVPRPDRGYLETLREPVGRLRVAFCPVLRGGSAPSETALAPALAVARRLEAMGHIVVEAAPDLDITDTHRMNYALFLGGFRAAVEALAATTGLEIGPQTLEAMTLASLADAESMTIERLHEGMAILESQTLAMDRFFEAHDLLVMPGVGRPPFPVGFADPMRARATGLDYWLEELPHFDTSPLANVTGHPALVIPPLELADGMPLGIQLCSRKNADGLLFRIAQALEDEAGWQHRRPPVHVTTSDRSAS